VKTVVPHPAAGNAINPGKSWPVDLSIMYLTEAVNLKQRPDVAIAQFGKIGQLKGNQLVSFAGTRAASLGQLCGRDSAQTMPRVERSTRHHRARSRRADRCSHATSLSAAIDCPSTLLPYFPAGWAPVDPLLELRFFFAKTRLAPPAQCVATLRKRGGTPREEFNSTLEYCVSINDQASFCGGDSGAPLYTIGQSGGKKTAFIHGVFTVRLGACGYTGARGVRAWWRGLGHGEDAFGSRRVRGERPRPRS